MEWMLMLGVIGEYLWRTLDQVGHAKLIEFYLQAAGFQDVEVRRLLDGWASDPLTVVLGRA